VLAAPSTLNYYLASQPGETASLCRQSDDTSCIFIAGTTTGEAAMAAFVKLEGRNMAALLDRRGRRAA
jgi:hypothetical protein